MSWLSRRLLSDADLLSLVVMVVLGILSFVPFGVLTATLIMLIKRGETINALVTSAALFFGGVLYPVASLPGWLQGASKALPFTYALEGVRRALYHGDSLSDLGVEVAVLVAFAAVFLPLSFMAFAAAVRRTKRTGTIGAY